MGSAFVVPPTFPFGTGWGSSLWPCPCVPFERLSTVRTCEPVWTLRRRKTVCLICLELNHDSLFSLPNALPSVQFWILCIPCILFILCFVSLSSCCAFPFQITDCMLRTIQNVVDMTADVYKTPYLRIDLFCEESGIEAVPKVSDIIAIYHKIINDVSASV